MKTIGFDYRKELETALRACLGPVPFVKIEAVTNSRSGDKGFPAMIVAVGLPQGRRSVALGFKSSGNPRFARDAVNELILYCEKNPDTYGIFAAPFISEASARICENEGVGYLDFSGNCRLCIEQTFIERKGQPNRFAEKRGLRSLYSPKAERILRVLLTDPKRLWRFQSLAREANVSLGLVAKVKKLLDEREWTGSEADGFNLMAPESLLREWAGNYDLSRNRARGFFTLKGRSEIEAELTKVSGLPGLRFALACFSAADMVAPTVRQNRVYLHLEQGETLLKKSLDLKEVPSGANVMILTPYDEGVFYDTNRIHGIPTVSAIQAYLDLAGNPGRGEEAAEAILVMAIKPRW